MTVPGGWPPARPERASSVASGPPEGYCFFRLPPRDRAAERLPELDPERDVEPRDPLLRDRLDAPLLREPLLRDPLETPPLREPLLRDRDETPLLGDPLLRGRDETPLLRDPLLRGRDETPLLRDPLLRDREEIPLLGEPLLRDRDETPLLLDWLLRGRLVTPLGDPRSGLRVDTPELPSPDDRGATPERRERAASAPSPRVRGRVPVPERS